MREALAELGVVVAPLAAPRAFRVEGCGGRVPGAPRQAVPRQRRHRLAPADRGAGDRRRALRARRRAADARAADRRPRRRAARTWVPASATSAATASRRCLIDGDGARAGGAIDVRGDVSSQFLSALLMALPLARGAAAAATTLRLSTPLISRPYVAITTNLMRRFGVTVGTPDADTFVVPAGAALRESRHDPRRGRRVGGFVFPRRRRARRRTGAGDRRRPRLDPGRRRVRRRAAPAGRRRPLRSGLDRGAARRAAGGRDDRLHRRSPTRR